MAIYLKIPGIRGQVSARHYAQWIEINDFEFSVKRQLNTLPGNVFDREVTRPSISEIIIYKQIDAASPYLFSEACVGKAKSNLQLHLVQSTGEGGAFMEYRFDQVIFSGYQIIPIKSESPQEMIQFSYAKIEMKYIPYDAENHPQTPIPAGYDLNSATKI